VAVEGAGECRENSANLFAGTEQGAFDVVIATGVEYLIIDTSPKWMETFIATAQSHHICAR
jgi:hypothetical protein